MLKKSLLKQAIGLVKKGHSQSDIERTLKVSQWDARKLHLTASAFVELKETLDVPVPKIKPSKTKEMHIVINDIHFPFQDKKTLELVTKFIYEQSPQVLHLLGDVVDFYNISNFNKNPNRKFTLQDELDQVTEYLFDLRHNLPNTRIIYYEGNHENRLQKHLWSKSPELGTLRALQLQKLLQFKELHIEYFDYNTYNKEKHLALHHGALISKWSGYTAKRVMETVGCSVIVGHCHRLGSSFHTSLGGNHVAYENGCLCQLNPEYMKGKPNWQLGFSVIYFVGDQFFVTQIPIINYSFIWNGELYKL